MKTTFNIILVIILLNPLSGFSIEGELDKGTISGKVIEKETSNPISFASVALVEISTNNIISGVISDDNGNFIIENIPYGNYKLNISFIGYQSSTSRDINLSRKNKKVELAPTSLAINPEEIAEAVVSTERLKGEEKIDRTVFTLNEDIRKASSSGLDVLKHIPSVTVDFQENVTLEGEANIQFYVDGVLRNKDYVSQLDPHLIDKVELLTNPGVKYDSDVAGIINIVLKKVKRHGVNGRVQVPIPHPEKIIAHPQASMEYGNQKFRIYAADRLNYERFPGAQYMFTELDDSNPNPYQFEKSSDGVNTFRFNYFNYGIDWFINDKNSLNLFGENRSRKNTTKEFESRNSTFDDNILTEYYKTVQDGTDRSYNNYISLFYKHKFNNEGTELTAEGYVNMEAGKNRNFYTDYYSDVSDITVIDNILYRDDVTDNSRNTIELKLDYSFNLKGIRTDIGYRTYAHWMNNDFVNNFTSNGSDGIRTDNFKFEERRQTGYFNLTGKIKKMGWQLGLKTQYSLLDINNSSTTDYFVFLPQLNLNHPLGKSQSLKFSLRRQIRRPGIRQLNPFEVWTDSLHLRRGNPDLDPAIENRMELTFSKNFKNNFISPKLYLRYTQNGIQDLTEITGNGVSEIYQANIGKELEYGVGINTALQLAKRWRFNGNISIFNREIDSKQELSLYPKEEKFSYRFGLTNIFILPKDFSLFLVSYYGSPNISYQREHSRDLLVIMGAQKKISDKLNIEMFYNPLIKNFAYAKVLTQSPGYKESWEGNVDVHHLFSLEISYRFSYGSKIKQIKRSAEYEKEEGGGAL